MASATISSDYLKEQEQLHSNASYGTASRSYAPLVKRLAELVQAESLADYGAGKKNLQKSIARLGLSGIDYRPYDPVFPEYGPPRKADVVCCIDVLEHIEPNLLDTVLDDIGGIVTNVGLLTVHTGPAVKHLSDGRNAHIIQQPPSWWLPRLSSRFEIRHLQTVPNGFLAIIQPGGSELDPRLTPRALNRLSGPITTAINPYPHSRLKTWLYRFGLIGIAKKIGNAQLVRRRD